MAERPDDDWFRSAGWTEFATCWVRDYYDDTVRYGKRSGLIFNSFTPAPYWAKDAIANNDPVALHAAWLEEEKRQATPLDPDGWTHLENVGMHTSGYHYTRDHTKRFHWVVYTPNLVTLAAMTELEDVVEICNEHARENGVKSC